MNAYLQFIVGQQTYALSIHNVIEVVDLVAITPIPDQAVDQLGVITLRGKVIPVLDLSQKFKKEATKLTLSTPLIIVRHHERTAALVVEQVNGVVILSDNLEPCSEASIEAITHVNNQVVMLPDLHYLTH